MGAGLEYRVFFDDFENLTAELDIDKVFDMAVRRAYGECENNEDVIAISDAYREADEVKEKQRLIEEIQKKQKEREQYES